MSVVYILIGNKFELGMGERGEGEERVGEMGAEVALALGCDGICGGDSCVVDNCCDGYFAFL